MLDAFAELLRPRLTLRLELRGLGLLLRRQHREHLAVHLRAQHRRVGFRRGQFGSLGPHRLLVELRRRHDVALGAVRRPHPLADRPQLVAVAVHHLSHLGALVVGQVELPQHPQRPAEAAASEAARATGTARPSPLVPRRRRAGAVLRLGVHEARRHHGGHRGRAEHPCQ